MIETVLCLALNIYFEARNQSADGQLMVAEVTINRSNNSDFPDNICDVVWQPGAFSWTQDGKSDKPRDLQAFTTSLLVAYDALYQPEVLLGTEATYYHEKSIRPYWADSFTMVGRVDDHIFYAEN